MFSRQKDDKNSGPLGFEFLMSIANHLAITRIHHLYTGFRHFINNHIMMEYFFYDYMGNGRHWDFGQAVHSAAYPFGLKAKFIQGVHQGKDRGSPLAGRRKVTDVRNGKMELIMRGDGSD